MAKRKHTQKPAVLRTKEEAASKRASSDARRTRLRLSECAHAVSTVRASIQSLEYSVSAIGVCALALRKQAAECDADIAALLEGCARDRVHAETLRLEALIGTLSHRRSMS